MNEQASRTLDRWVGVPWCWLLTLWRRLADGLRGQRAAQPPQRILFVKLAEMGAIVLTMPAFETARRMVGRDNLFIVMLAANRQVHDLLQVFPSQNVWVIRDQSLFTFAIDIWRLMRHCRRERIDAVIDLEGFARVSAALSYLTGARLRVGLHRYTVEGLYRGDLFTHRVAVNYYQHASVQFLAMVEALATDPTRREEQPLLKRVVSLGDYQLPSLVPTPAERDHALEMLAQVNGGDLPPRPWLVLNPNLIDLLPLRRWPEECWRELGRRLLVAHPQATLLLTGLPAERDVSQALARQIDPKRCLSLAGETESLRALVVLFAECGLLITSDCGPAHMAALTDLPIVSIFGPETPQLYAPLSPRNLSLWAGLACSPCLNAFNHRHSACRNNVCLQSISVEQVFAAAARQLPELAPAPAPRAASAGPIAPNNPSP